MDAENNDCAVEVAATKQGRRVRRRLIHATDYQHNSPFAPEPSFHRHSFWSARMLLARGGLIRALGRFVVCEKYGNDRLD
jgi:hypothetical protein